MAWKTISLHGWWVSFERDSDVYLKHEEVSESFTRQGET